MERSRIERLAPLAGVLAVVLIIVAIVIFPEETPSIDDSRAKVVKFWLDHDDEAAIASILLALSAVPFLWFAGSLRATLRAAEPAPGRVSSIAFAGMIVFAGGIAAGAMLMFTVADGADDLPPVAIQTLSALSADYFFPFLIGVATWMLATAVAILRYRAMHVAFGWTALIIGIAALTPVGFFGFIASGLWTLVASIALYVAAGREAAPPAAPAVTAPD
jgi:hypothetical protein